mmetsp:Transcript_37928/g.93005  ORF Transcript_37928/g.93005 Transcript_37928/m.93005 type:complete len:210 (-) Transcript_37928:354-983(-)
MLSSFFWISQIDWHTVFLKRTSCSWFVPCSVTCSMLGFGRGDGDCSGNGPSTLRISLTALPSCTFERSSSKCAMATQPARSSSTSGCSSATVCGIMSMSTCTSPSASLLFECSDSLIIISAALSVSPSASCSAATTASCWPGNISLSCLIFERRSFGSVTRDRRDAVEPICAPMSPSADAAPPDAEKCFLIDSTSSSSDGNELFVCSRR